MVLGGNKGCSIDVRSAWFADVVGVWQAAGKLVLLAPLNPLFCGQKALERSFQWFSFSTANEEENLPASWTASSVPCFFCVSLDGHAKAYKLVLDNAVRSL